MEEAQAAYLIEPSKFLQQEKAQYDDAKDAFNKMVAERRKLEKYKQDLTFSLKNFKLMANNQNHTPNNWINNLLDKKKVILVCTAIESHKNV